MTATYTVTVKRWDKGWELHVEGVGVTQARKLAELDEMALDLICKREQVAPADVELRWNWQVGQDQTEQPQEAEAS